MVLPIRNSDKAKVDLAAPARIGSRIRRDPPPPPPHTVTAGELRTREAWKIGVGITTLALALTVAILGIGGRAGWSPADYTLLIRDGD